jgi:hypothetical protein
MVQGARTFTSLLVKGVWLCHALCFLVQVKVLEHGIKHGTASDADNAKQALAYCCFAGLSRVSTQVKVLERGIKYGTTSDADNAKQALAHHSSTRLPSFNSSPAVRGAGEGA